MTSATPASAPTLSGRALNRATLQRQLLLERSAMSVPEALGHLVGLQAQVPEVPYLALAARLNSFAPADLAELLRSREAVRLSLMRGTIHLVTAEDAEAIRPLVQPVLSRAFTTTAWGRELAGRDLAEIADAGRELLAGRPLPRVQLGEALQQRWPDVDAASLAMAVTFSAFLVQVTPRGVWGETGPPAFAPLDVWLRGRSRHADPATLDTLVLRYLAAFGPASVRDVQTWCGLTRLREVIEPMAARLRRFQGEDGRELYDVPDGPLPDPDVPAPPRFLPEFDNALISYAERTRVLGEGNRLPYPTGRGGFVGTLLVDGLVVGTWAVRMAGGEAVLEITPSLARVPRSQWGPVAEEGRALLALLAPGSPADVRLLPAD